MAEKMEIKSNNCKPEHALPQTAPLSPNPSLPQKNGIMEILKFFTRKQHKDEPFEKFYADLKSLVRLCGFADQETKLLRAQIVIGIESKSLQEQLLREDISLENTILHCKSVEAAGKTSQTCDVKRGTKAEPEKLLDENVKKDLQIKGVSVDESTSFESADQLFCAENGKEIDVTKQVDPVSTTICSETTENDLSAILTLRPNVLEQEYLGDDADGNSEDESDCDEEDQSDVTTLPDTPMTPPGDVDHQPSSSEEVLFLNMANGQDLNFFHCLDCPKTFSRSETLARHRRIAHGVEKPYVCGQCGKAFSRRDCFIIHQTVHSRDRPFNCNQCHKTFTRKDHLVAHKRTHLKIKPFKCSICGKSFPRKTNLARHLLIHTEEKKFGCKICGRLFARKEHLTGHQLVHSEVKPYECNQCGKSFTLEATMIRHQRIVHTDADPIICGDCGKSFTRKDSFATHRLTHSEVKPFSCNVCEKTFSRKDHLTAHAYIHSEVKPYSCTECGKAFSRETSLMRHNLTHSEVKPFDCVQCGKTFSRKEYLIVHSLTHSEVKPFDCNECGKAFNRKEHLVRHQKSNHRMDVMNLVDIVLKN